MNVVEKTSNACSRAEPSDPGCTAGMEQKLLNWELPHGIEVAFSHAGDGDLRDVTQRQAWLKRIDWPLDCIVPRQIHGTLVVVANDAAGLLVADGVVSRSATLGVYGADCPGLCIATPHALGMAHCGWRGTAGGIVARLVAAVAALTTDPRDTWHALIGPGISAPAYEVDAPVLTARHWPATALTARDAGHAGLDLSETIRCDLVASGVVHILSSGICTHRDPRLHSYRWQGQGPTQLLAARRRPG